MRWPLLILLFLAGCASGAYLPPANSAAFLGPAQSGRIVPGSAVRDLFSFSASQPGLNSEPLLYADYTVPLFVTEHPAGPSVESYSAVCVFWICFGESSDERIAPHSALVRIHSADAASKSLFLGTITVRTIVLNGWTEKDQEKLSGRCEGDSCASRTGNKSQARPPSR